MSQLIKQVHMLLPDDIVELIYNQIIYSPPKELLDEIKYYYKLKRYINLIKDADHPQQLAYLYDIGIVYFSIQKDNKPRVKYDKNLVPDHFFDNLLVTIDGSKSPMKKTKEICVHYMLKIPYRHIKHIFKPHRSHI